MVKMLPFILRMLRSRSLRTLKKSAEADFRALIYMRPLAIWAMQWELDKTPDFRAS